MRKIFFLLVATLFYGKVFSSGHNATITVTQNVSCFGLSDGQATCSVTGGAGPFAYSWSNAQAGQQLQNVTAGNYYCIVTDSVDMSTDTAFCSISQPAQINLLASSSSPVCDNYMLTLYASGAQSYTWLGANGFSSNQQNPSINSINTSMSGIYTVMGNVGACSANASVYVTVLSAPSLVVGTTSVSCFGMCDGTFSPSVSGGQPPYTYQWQSSSSGQNLQNICAGNYTVGVTDAYGCTNYTIAYISQPSPITLNLIATPATNCSACDGSVSITATGGSSGFVSSWTGPNGFTSSAINLTNICTGNYTATALDSNGCTMTSTAAVTAANLSISITSKSDSCGHNTGSLVASVSGNSPNLNYNWQPGNQTTQGIYSLSAGSYTLTVTDSLGCQSSAIANISNLYNPYLFTTANSASCGSANGLIVATASWGVSPYGYSINGGQFSTVNSWNLAAGSYTITVKDSVGCENSKSQFVNNAGINVSANVTHANCNNNSNGSASIIASGGTAPYTYQWSNGDTTQSINNVFNGYFKCTVTDTTGCSGTATVWIGQNSSLYVDCNSSDYNCGTNSLTANVSGGTAPYSYSWSPIGSTTQTISGLNPGTYSLTVTDATGCTGTGYGEIYSGTYSTIEGEIFNDVNTSCSLDGGDYPINYGWVKAQSAFNIFYGGVYNTNSSHYQLHIPASAAGTYTLTGLPVGFANSNNFSLNCASNYTVTVNGNCDTIQHVDFPYTVIPFLDILSNIYCNTARPGFIRYYSIDYSNLGTDPANGIVKIDIDPLLTFIGATPAPSFVNGNHIEWNYTNLYPYSSRYICLQAQVPLIQNGGVLGTVLHDSVWIDPIAGDVNVSNNFSSCSSLITGSYDPNIKEVYSSQADANGVIDTSGAELYYTVHFQNTGTDTAFTVTVKDTLSPLVDLTSLEMLGASDNFKWSIEPGRCLTVVFNNILLVDSNMNEAASHGYFHYRVHTAAIAPGNTIENTAAIYFDFNPAIITNTVTTPVAVTLGIAAAHTINATVFPNPTNTGFVRIQLNGSSYKKILFSLFDVCGNVAVQKTFENEQQFDADVSKCAGGIYFYQVVNEKGETTTGKLIITK
jgi:uncharacterized repeat protein (TIGR01451 family)